MLYLSIKYIVLTIYLKNGKSKTFPYSDGKPLLKAVAEKSVLSIFYYYVCEFNIDKMPEEQISVHKSWLITKMGAIILYSTLISAIVIIIIYIICKPKASVPTSIGGIFITISLLGKRASDKATYKYINQLTPRSPFE